jgi:L-alanine-DL-glutamate epimerase-like enolase superfamily enzyme
MTLTDTRPSATTDPASGLKIATVEAIRLNLPYKKAITFAGHTESTSQYVILRIALADGTEGIAESVCRPSHTGEDAVSVAYQLETFFKPLLVGGDPLGHLALLAKI